MPNATSACHAFQVSVSGFRASGFGLRVSIFGFRQQAHGPGLGFRVSGFGWRADFIEMCSGFEADSYLSRIDLMHYLNLGLRVIKEEEMFWLAAGRGGGTDLDIRVDT